MSMHSREFELTKLTYTRLDDNLIRHRGDRFLYSLAAALLVLIHASEEALNLGGDTYLHTGSASVICTLRMPPKV